MDAVALRAGVTKPTIYRRYTSKTDLAAAALEHLAAARDAQPPDDHGDVAAQLVAQLRHFRAGVERPFGVALVGTVLAEEQETPELLGLYREVIVGPRRAMIRRVLEQARERGEIRSDADLDLAVSAMIGSYYARYLETGAVDEDWPERIVATLLAGIGS